jgi:polyhydroxybutyrate depolymerase
MGTSYTRTFDHDGITRTYIAYVPTGLTGPASLVLCLHGGGFNPAWMAGATFFNYVADYVDPSFVVVYPYGTDIFGTSSWYWNDGRKMCDGTYPTVDDVGFLRAIPADLASLIMINENKIYCCGISNGGYMTWRMAQQASDFVAAVGVVAAARNVNQTFAAPPRAMPIIDFHGTDDAFDPYYGGLFGIAGNFINPSPPIEDAMATWSVHNGGDGLITNTIKAKSLWWMSFSPGNINLWRVVNGGHTWPRIWSNPNYDPYPLGEINHQVHTSYQMWQFWKNISL